MRRLILVVGLAVALALSIGGSVSEVSAAPITCPDGQIAVKVQPGTWECKNKGGNYDNAGHTKNPNDNK